MTPLRPLALALSLLLPAAVTLPLPALAQAQPEPRLAAVKPRLDQVDRLLEAAARGNANAAWDAKTEIEELPYPARGDRRQARRLNTAALEKFKAGQMPEALAEFDRAWQADPSDQEIANNYGYALYRNQRLPQAESLLRYTLALAPARAAAWANLAEVFGAQNRPEQAAAAFVLSHRFSRNPDTTRQYIEQFSTGAKAAELPGLKAGATMALARLFPPPAQAGGATAQPLSGTASERRAIEIGEGVASVPAPPPVAPAASAAAPADELPAVPACVPNPMRAYVVQQMGPEVYPLYVSASQGSAEARERLLRLANDGDAKAQSAAGSLYDFGLGVPSDHALANGWYRKAAASGFPLAQFSLGWNYGHGFGVASDAAQEFDGYLKAAQQGHAVAMNNVGVMYARGIGAAADDMQATRWFLASAQAGLPRGAFNAAVNIERGRGTTKDLRLALAYYLSAARIGFVAAQYKAGEAYENGWLGKPDKAQAIEWYKRAALQGLEGAKDALKRLGVTDY